MRAGTRRVTEPLLECYLAGSLDAEARAQVEAILAESAVDRARLEELRAESAAFLMQNPPDAVMERFDSSERWRKLRLLCAPVLAALAAMVPVVLVPGEELYMTRGEGSLSVYQMSAESVGHRMCPGDTVQPCSLLPVVVQAHEKSGYVAVLRRDGKGTVTVHYPRKGVTAAPYDEKSPVLPAPLKVCDVEGTEEVYAIFSPDPFDLDWAVPALEKGRHLASVAPEGMTVKRTAFVVEKSFRPGADGTARLWLSEEERLGKLELYREREDVFVRVRSNTELFAGDTLLFDWSRKREGGEEYLAILSRDAAGEVIVHHPEGARTAAPHATKGSLLPGESKLVGSGLQDVYVLSSSNPFELDWAVWALREGWCLQGLAPRGISVKSTSIWVRPFHPSASVPDLTVEAGPGTMETPRECPTCGRVLELPEPCQTCDGKDLQPLGRRLGTLEFHVQPSTLVVLDGMKLGHTPLAPIDVQEGSHTVRLINRELGEVITRTVVVRAGEANVLEQDLLQD